MSNQYFGDYTRLIPPIVVDGEEYGLAVKFSRQPTNQVDPVKILSGQVVSSTSLPNSLKRIVCKRGAQTSSYTVVPGAGSQPFEVTYRCQTGGNICHTTERDRVNNFANQMNYGGPDFGTRLRAGDVLVLKEGDRVKRYTIVETDAFGQAPDEVDWQGRDPLPTIQYIAMDNYEVQMIAEDGESFSFGEAAPYNETGAYDDSANLLTRKIFNDDEESYEYNADLPSGEFWYSPTTGVFYFGEIDTDTIEVYYWQVGFQTMEASSFQKVIIECTEEETPLGINGDSDLIALSSEFYLEEFSEVFALEYGNCVLEYRSSLQPRSRVVGIEINIDAQDIVSAYERTTEEGMVDSVAFDEYSPSPWGLFRVRRVGNQLFIEQAVGGSWSIVKQFTIDFGPGFLSVGTTSQAKFYVFPKEVDDYTRTRYIGLLDVEGKQSRRVSTSAKPYRKFTTVNAQSSEPIEEIKLLRSDVDEEVTMFSRNTLAGGKRNSYHKDGNKLYFYPEANSDRIRVTYKAPTSAPPKPGMPPQSEGVKVLNFGTRVDGSGIPGESTNNVSENRGNWHDVIVFHDPHDDGDTVPGDSFDGERGAFASSQFPPSFHYDIKDGEGDWTLLPLAERLWYAPEGILLIKESFRAGIEGNLCVRATFTESGGRCGALLNNAGIDAQQVNELAQAIATMRNLWVPLTLSGGANVGVSGSTAFYGLGSRTYDCANGARTTSRTLGQWGADFTTWANQGRPNPHWLTSGGGPRLWGATGEYGHMTDTWRDIPKCGPEDGPTNGSTTQTGIVQWGVNPYGRAGGADFDYVGAVPPTGGGSFSTLSAFSFQGYGLGLDPMMMRMLQGATCLEAKARVIIYGVKYLDWSWRRKQTSGFLPEIDDYIVNGTTFQGDIAPGMSTLLADYASPSAAVGFRLVGRRRITRQIQTWDGATQPVLDGEYKTFPGSIAGSTLESNQWGMVDVTNAINSLLKDKDSTYLEYFLYPSVAGASPEDDPASLGGYVAGQIASGSGSVTYDEEGRGTTDDQMSGSYLQYTGMAISGIWARFSIPGTQLNDMWLPFFMPPQAQEEE